MTDKIRAVAEAAKRDDCQVVVTCPDRGPITIESSYDEAYAIGPTIDLVKQASELPRSKLRGIWSLVPQR